MKTVQIAQLKAHLSKHLREVREGETLTVLDRSTPVARIVPIESTASRLVIRPAKKPFGSLKRLGPSGVSPEALARALVAERQDRQ